MDWCAFRLLTTIPTDSSYLEWTPELEKKLNEVTKNETRNKSQTKHKVGNKQAMMQKVKYAIYLKV